MTTTREIARRVAERSGVYVNPRSIERVALALLEERDFWRVVDRSDTVVPVTAAAVEAFRDLGWVEIRDGALHITPEGERVWRRKWRLNPPPRYTCAACTGRGLEVNRIPERVRETFLALHRERPEAVHEYDQGFITPDSTLARCAYALAKGDIEGKRVLILGDDDLVSLALGLMARPQRLVVVEIDERLVRFIARHAEHLDIPVEIHSLDLSRPLPESFHRAFDTFLCDPPESFTAFRAFVGRGLTALHGAGCAGYFGFTHREATLRKWHQVESYLMEQGAVLTDIVPNFHTYENWDYAPETRAWRLAPVPTPPAEPWYRSALFRLETLGPASGEPSEVFDATTFNDEEASTT